MEQIEKIKKSSIFAPNQNSSQEHRENKSQDNF